MNCKPGDLARTCLMPVQLDRVHDRIVKLKELPPFYVVGVLCWQLEEPLPFLVVQDFRSGGTWWYRGQERAFAALPDKHLRPIRGLPGDDQTLAWAGTVQERMRREIAAKTKELNTALDRLREVERDLQLYRPVLGATGRS